MYGSDLLRVLLALGILLPHRGGKGRNSGGAYTCGDLAGQCRTPAAMPRVSLR